MTPQPTTHRAAPGELHDALIALLVRRAERKAAIRRELKEAQHAA